MIFQNKQQTAKQIGVSIHSIVKYIAREKNPLPYLKSKANKVKYKGKIFPLSEELKSANNQRKLIFVEEDVKEWIENHY